MKKLFTSIMVFLVTLSMSLSGVFASSYDVDEALSKSKNYYQSLEQITGSDKKEAIDNLIAAKSLGVDVKTSQLPEGFGTIDDETDTGEVTKTAIAEVLMGNDPRNVDGKNLISIIENMVQDGKVMYNGEPSEISSAVAYVVYALYMADSSKLDDAADYLASLQNDDGSFGYYKGGVSLDCTGFALEALALTNKTEAVNKAISFLSSKLQDDGHYMLMEDDYYNPGEQYDAGANSDTQAVIIAGLLASGQNVSEKQYDYLLQYQLTSGGFGWQDNTYLSTYSTQDGARALGTYKNGSVFTKAKNAYQDIISKKDTTEDNKTQSQENKTEEKETTTNTNNQTTNKDNTNTQTTSTTNNTTQAVKTSDNEAVLLFGVMMLVSGLVLYKNKNEVER